MCAEWCRGSAVFDFFLVVGRVETFRLNLGVSEI